MFFPLIYGGCDFTVTDEAYSGSGGAAYMAAQGNYLYLALTATDELVIWDISSPVTPSVVSTTSIGSSKGTRDIRVSGDYVYLVNETADELAIWNVSNPAAPTPSGSVSVGAAGCAPKAVEVVGDHAFVVLGAYSLTENVKVVDISNKAAPVVIHTWVYSALSGYSMHNIHVNGIYLYVTGDGGGGLGSQFLFIIDKSTLTNLVTTGFYSWPNVAGSWGAGGVWSNGNYAYVYLATAARLSVVDLADKANPAEAGITAITGAGAGATYSHIAVDAETVYCGQYNGANEQVWMVDVSTKNSPTTLGGIDSNDDGIGDVLVHDGRCKMLIFSAWSGTQLVVFKGLE